MPILYNGIQSKTIEMQNAVIIPLQGQIKFLVLYFCINYCDFERQENVQEALISPSDQKSKSERILENAAILEMQIKKKNAEDLGGLQSSMIL